MTSLAFTVDSALLSELGEKLVESVHIALNELVKNSYDADSTEVTVRFIEKESGGPEVHVIDNGTNASSTEQPESSNRRSGVISRQYCESDCIPSRYE